MRNGKNHCGTEKTVAEQNREKTVPEQYFRSTGPEQKVTKTVKKMLKKLPSKYPEGTIVNIGYVNKKKKLIFKDVKVGSND